MRQQLAKAQTHRYCNFETKVVSLVSISDRRVFPDFDLIELHLLLVVEQLIVI